MAYRDYAYSVLDKYLDEKEARHVYDQAFMKRMYWLEKAVEGGEVYAMDTLADFYTSGIYGKGKFDDKVRLENIARDKGKALYWTMQLRRHTKDPEEIKDLDWWINALKNGEDISDCVGKCDD